jgi:hypothetical protein
LRIEGARNLTLGLLKKIDVMEADKAKMELVEAAKCLESKKAASMGIAQRNGAPAMPEPAQV